MTNKIRIRNWKPIYAALAAGQEFETQKGMKAVAPKMDHNLPMILIQLGYITPHPPYKMAKKIWDWNKVDSRLRAYYKERKSGNSMPLAKPTGPTLTAGELKLIDQLAWKDAKPISFFADEELVSELRRRGYEVTAKKTVEL